ncbi:MAG: hypothetical protein ACI8RD_014279 [Bacillariaceae sp.]|jgi:hypothetical protein
MSPNASSYAGESRTGKNEETKQKSEEFSHRVIRPCK